MPLALSLAVVALVIVAWAQVCVRIGQWQTGRSEGTAGAVPWRRPQRAPRVVLLPEGHRPPTGLAPLSPSERFLTQEYTRGLRDLQMYLVDQQTAQGR